LEFESRVTEETADTLIDGTLEMTLELGIVNISAKVEARVADGKKVENKNVSINYTGNFPQPTNCTYDGAIEWIGGVHKVTHDDDEDYKQRFLTVYPLSTYTSVISDL
jgi:hypothetical protein